MKIKTIKFNFAMNMLLTVSNFLFPLLTFPYVSRVLGPEGTGKVAFAYSIVSYFTILAAFGVANYGVRACARVRDNRTELSRVVHEILIINTVLMLLVYIGYVLGVLLIPELREEKELFIISGLNILFTIVGVEWVYRGLEQYSYIAIRSIFFKLIAFVLVFVCVNSQDDYQIYAFIIIFATVGSGVINFVNLRKVIDLCRYPFYEFKRHVRPMLVFFLITIAVACYVNLSVAFLGFWKGNEEVGYYNAAYRIKDVMVSVITALGAVLLPRLSYYIENNMHDKFNEVVEKSMRFVFVFSLPLVVFCILFAEPAVLILAGPAYRGSVVPLQFLSIIIFIVGVSNLTGIQMLIPLKREKQLCYSVVLAAFCSVALNFALVPSLGAVGSAISVAISELCILILQVYFLRNFLRVIFGGISYHKLAAALVLASLTAVILSATLVFNNIVVFVISSTMFFVIYFVALMVFRESFVCFVIDQLLAKVFKRARL